MTERTKVVEDFSEIARRLKEIRQERLPVPETETPDPFERIPAPGPLPADGGGFGYAIPDGIRYRPARPPLGGWARWPNFMRNK